MNTTKKIGSKAALSIMLVFALVFNLLSLTMAPVTVRAAATDATLSAIKMNTTSFSSTSLITGFSPSTLDYLVVLPSSVTDVPVIEAQVTDTVGGATYQIINAASIPGTTSIVVTSGDLSTTKTYKVHFSSDPNEANFSEDFESVISAAPAGTIDETKKWQSGTYGSPSTAVPGNGAGHASTNAYTMDEDTDFLQKTLGRHYYGTVTAWVYDPLGVAKGTAAANQYAMTLVYDSNSFTSSNLNAIAAGINLNNATNSNNYMYRPYAGAAFVTTGVARSQGWHKIVYNYSATGTTLQVDNATAVTPSSNPKTGFNTIAFGDIWSPDTLVSGKRNGAFFDDISFSNITPVPVNTTDIKVKDTAVTLDPGGTKMLKAFVLPYDSTDAITWSSSDPTVATVDPATGLVTAVASGTATITATSNAKTSTSTVTVHAPAATAVTGVTLDQATASVDVNATKTLVATVQPVNATNKAVTWSSSDPTIAVVDTNGVVSGVKAGTATITATTADGSYTASCVVTVQGQDPPFIEDFENGFALNGWRNVNFNNPNRATIVDSDYLADVPIPSQQSTTKAFLASKGDKTKSAFLQKKFSKLSTGVITVSFYDNAANTASTTNNQFNIYNSANASFGSGYSTGSNNLIGLGITNGQSTSKYVLRTGSGGNYSITTVDRTTGWHKFKFVVTSTGTTAYIDDQQVGTVHTGVTSFDTIDMGDFWSTNGASLQPMYYDDLKITFGDAPDSSLSEISVDGTPISGFTKSNLNYYVQVPNATPIPVVIATKSDANATMNIIQATAVPGYATIAVTSKDGSETKTYKVNFTLPQPVQEFFDDFKYTSHADPELWNHNWRVQDGDGQRPGNLATQWKASNVKFGAGPADTAFPGETDIMTISAEATGTASTSSQAQIREAYEKFGDGVYSSRIYFTDRPEVGNTNAKDKIVETFFPINRNQYIGWQGYSEVDFEYLPNDGWGASASGPAMYFTSWGPYTLSSAGSQVNVSKSSNSSVKSYAGWHTMTIVVKNGTNYYYIDGQKMATHGQPAGGIDSPVAPAFNLWFIGGGLDASTISRTWNQYVSWTYYTNDLSAFNSADANISTTIDANVKAKVNGYKATSTAFIDTVPNPVVTASGIKVNGIDLSGFDPNVAEYSYTTTGSTVPTITATATDSLAIVTVIPATNIPGTTTVMVQSTDLVLNKTYHINFSSAGNTAVAPPAASVGNGAFVQAFDVVLSTPINNGADIYYTTDGTTPTTSSNKYTGPITIAKASPRPTMNTIKAIAVLNGNTSQEATFKYATMPLTPQVVAAPVITPNGGTFSGSATVTITDTATAAAIKGENIYYTIDGTDPTTSASRILYAGPFQLTSSTTVKTVATFPGATTSNGVVSATFTVTTPQVAAPTASPIAGTYTSEQSVTLSSTTPSATIYYTTDGSTPTTSSTLYTGPINVGSSMTIKAIATAASMTNSSVSQFAYVIISGVPVDKTALNAKIAAALSTFNAALIHPTRFGYYPQSAVDALNAAITSAVAVANNASATQGQVDQAVSNVDTALVTFAGSVNTTASIGDLAITARNYGATSASADWASLRMYDLNLDNKLDILDLAELARKILGL